MFVFQEPSLLSSLQDNGLTDVMLHALLIKDVSYKLMLEANIGFGLKPSPVSNYNICNCVLIAFSLCGCTQRLHI